MRISPFSFASPLAAVSLTLLIAGCSLSRTALPTASSGLSIRGEVHGGQAPIVGAHVYLVAAGTSGYGGFPSPLLNPAATGNADGYGGYVVTASDGSFSIGGDYTCTPHTQILLAAVGGDPGAGANSASTLLAVLGDCPNSGTFATTVPHVWINEVSTVAAAYAIAAFATDVFHISSSGSSLAQTGIANAFANVSNLADISTGIARSTTPAGNGTVPQSEINTVANILASCVNSTGPSSTTCTTLFANATADGTSNGTQPTDTAAAAINMAHHPAANVHNLYTIPAPIAAFAPALGSEPNDFTIALSFTGAGITLSTGEASLDEVNNVAIDASGNVWRANYTSNSLSELSPLGAPISTSSGFTGGGLNAPLNVAIDLLGRVWTANKSGDTVSIFTPSGSTATGVTYSGAGLSSPSNIAIDTSGNAWITNANNTLSEMSSGGIAASGSPFTSNTLSNPFGIAVLPSGAVWTTNIGNDTVTAYTSAGAQATGSPFSGGGLTTHMDSPSTPAETPGPPTPTP